MIPAEWSALPGEFKIDRSSNQYFTENLEAIRVTHRISPTMKIGAIQTVSMDLLEDSAIDVMPLIMRSMDRFFRPWLYPKVTPWPQWEPFPRWTRFASTVRRMAHR